MIESPPTKDGAKIMPCVGNYGCSTCEHGRMK